MKVGIDASNIRAGGGLTHLSEMLRAGNPNDYGIDSVMVWGGQQTLSRLEHRDWLHREHVPALDKNLLHRIRWQTTQLPRLAQQQCDLLFAPGGTFAGAAIPFVTLSQNMLPFTPHEQRRYGTSWMRIRLWLLRQQQTRTFQRAKGLIFLTEYARNSVLECIKRTDAQIAIIPHGIDDRFRRAPRPQQGLGSFNRTVPFRLLYVSIVDVYKHQWHVVEGVIQLRQAGFPIIVDFIGPAYPPSLKRLQTVIEHHDPTGEVFHYHGPVPFAQLQQWYHQSDAFIFASSCENLPNILLEAMASGLPISCSKYQPMPEILGDEAVYFDPENPADIAENLKRLITSVDFRTRCADSAYRRSEPYTWSRCADQTLAFLMSVGH